MRVLSLFFVAALVTVQAGGCSSTLGSNDAGGTGGTASGTGGTGTGGAGTGGAGAGTGGTGGGSGGQGGQAGQNVMTCSPACGSGSICVATGTEGGVVIFANDAGVCPTGRHLSDHICVSDLSYACMTIPAGCAGSVTCACASSLCPASYTCLGSSGILNCIQEVP